jgi:hypothetical protein
MGHKRLPQPPTSVSRLSLTSRSCSAPLHWQSLMTAASAMMFWRRFSVRRPAQDQQAARQEARTAARRRGVGGNGTNCCVSCNRLVTGFLLIQDCSERLTQLYMLCVKCTGVLKESVNTVVQLLMGAPAFCVRSKCLCRDAAAAAAGCHNNSDIQCVATLATGLHSKQHHFQFCWRCCLV